MNKEKRKQEILEMASLIQQGEVDMQQGKIDSQQYDFNTIIKLGLNRLASAYTLYNAGYRSPEEIEKIKGETRKEMLKFISQLWDIDGLVKNRHWFDYVCEHYGIEVKDEE